MREALQTWHEFLAGDTDALDRLLAEDVVLYSPVLFRPIVGRQTVTMYLIGASQTFVGPTPSPGDGAGPQPTLQTDGEEAWDGRFRYRRVILGERDVVLEFETTMDGRYVNGVDMIDVDDDGRIVEFKVMVRPVQALEAVRQMMGSALEQLGGARP